MTQPTLQHIVCTSGDHAFRMAWWQWGDPNASHVVLCVHGLTRQGRDFDVLARALLADVEKRGLPSMRIICPDVPGRGRSEWLREPALYQVPTYVGAMLQLLAHLHQQAPIGRLDWVGTSMGGLIAMGIHAVMGTESWPLPSPIHKLVLNDVGPVITWESIQRIGSYVMDTGHFADEAEALAALQQRFVNFGPHTPEQWTELNRPMLRPHHEGGLQLHYDPMLGLGFRHVPREAFVQGEAILWKLYEAMRTPTLLLRGADSDLLTAPAAKAMTEHGPKPHLIEFAGVGHAPTLVQGDQVEAVRHFLLDAEA